MVTILEICLSVNVVDLISKLKKSFFNLLIFIIKQEIYEKNCKTYRKRFNQYY
jgi:hypothetical protein